MKYLRGALAAFVFTLAALGSIWIGWIYASPHEQARKQVAPSAVPNKGNSSSIRGEEVGAVRGYDALPELGSAKVLPGVGGDLSPTADLNGFPTISKEAVERAAGYGDLPVPSIEAPFKTGDSNGISGSTFSVAPSP